MRADVNLSVMEAGSGKLGTRTEMKNLNSFKAIARAIEGERQRQIDLLEEGKTVIQETRRWDDNKEYSFPMRSKEDAKDYRYFPEPDLVPVHISEDWITQIRSRQPRMREERKALYRQQYGLPEADAAIITESRKMADLFEAASEISGNPKKTANWLIGETMRLLKENAMEPEQIRFSPLHLAKLVKLTEDGTINGAAAKKVFAAMFEKDIDPEVFVEENGLKTVRDDKALRETIEKIVSENPKSVEDYRSGKKKAIGYLVGQTMKATRGKADPAEVSRILEEIL